MTRSVNYICNWEYGSDKFTITKDGAEIDLDTSDVHILIRDMITFTIFNNSLDKNILFSISAFEVRDQLRDSRLGK